MRSAGGVLLAATWTYAAPARRAEVDQIIWPIAAQDMPHECSQINATYSQRGPQLFSYEKSLNVRCWANLPFATSSEGVKSGPQAVIRLIRRIDRFAWGSRGSNHGLQHVQYQAESAEPPRHAHPARARNLSGAGQWCDGQKRVESPAKSRRVYLTTPSRSVQLRLHGPQMQAVVAGGTGSGQPAR